MYKKLISSRKEDLCLYIECNCGSEIIKLYYYRSERDCPEIILLDYIGHAVSEKHTKHKYIDLSQSSFYGLVNALNYCEHTTEHEYIISDGSRQLVISKQQELTNIELYYQTEEGGKKKTLNRVKVWSITIHDNELREVNLELESMKNKYEEINNAERSNSRSVETSTQRKR